MVTSALDNNYIKTTPPREPLVQIQNNFTESTLSNHLHAWPPFFMGEGLLSISPECCGQLVKMLINLEPNGIFGSNYAYLFILTLSRHMYAKRRRRFAKYYFGQSRYFSENAHNY